MAAPAPPTIISLKQEFVATQVRLLSQALAPSRTWRSANEAAADGLPAKAVSDVLVRLNHTLRNHARRVFPPQATRSIAEQLQTLYNGAVSRPFPGSERDGADADADADGLAVASDQTDEDVIASLPPTWEVQRDVDAFPLEAKRYAEMVAQLQALATRRAEARSRVVRLRKIRLLLEPFDSDVQQNLVTRDGEVEKELQRMRMLLARVCGRLGQLPEGDGPTPVVEDVERGQKRKLDELLDSF